MMAKRRPEPPQKTHLFDESDVAQIERILYIAMLGVSQWLLINRLLRS